MVDFDELRRRLNWKELRGCAGRFVLHDSFVAAPSELVGSATPIYRIQAAAARDPIAVALIAGGGLLSYARPDGSHLHTLNTLAGLRRKLDQLGIDLRQGPSGSDARAAIPRRIQEFIDAADPKLAGIAPAVRRFGFLPLQLDPAAVLGIKPDGSFVRWRHDPARDAIEPLLDPYWQRIALCAGAEKYPELIALLPPRPAGVAPCASCGGTGDNEAAPALGCRCGGLGWLAAGEELDAQSD